MSHAHIAADAEVVRTSKSVTLIDGNNAVEIHGTGDELLAFAYRVMDAVDPEGA